MTKAGKLILVLFILLVISAPLIQQVFSIYPREIKLFGAYIPAKDTILTSETWLSRVFQEREEQYLNENFGFRNLFVKLDNQINFSAFNIVNVNDVFKGKSNYLFSNKFYSNFSGLNYKGDRYVDSISNNLKHLNEYLKGKGTKLLVCFAPCKESFYPEFLPDTCSSKLKTTNYYTAYKRNFNDKGISVLDYHSLFQAMKGKSKGPLFTEGAVHWTTFGAVLALDTLLKRISYETGKLTSQININSVQLSDTSRFDDDDIVRAMNLLQNINSTQLAYPQTNIKCTTDSCYKPKILVVGDSFFYGLNNTWIPLTIWSPESYFLYYNRQAFPFNGKPDRMATEIDLGSELENTDLMILFFSIGTLDKFPYGITEFMNKK